MFDWTVLAAGVGAIYLPHGYCLQWNPVQLWVHVGSDATIAIAYIFIPVALGVFIQRQSNLRFKTFFLLFAAFILLCGATHVMAVFNVWRPAYELTGGIKAATAVVSVVTAAVIWPVLRAASKFIDEKVRLSSQLQRNQEHLRGLLENLPSAVVVHRPDTSIEYANPQARKLLGQSQERLLGTPSDDPRWQFLREDGSPMPIDEFPVHRILKERSAFHNYTVGVIGEGGADRPRWMQVNGFPELNGNGDLVRAIISFVDVTERRELESQLNHRANTDYLTGIANRRHFMTTASQEFARARRYGHALSLLMLDLDYFKRLNDRYGHVAGDDALRAVAGICQASLRQNDIASRMGGEEFAILLPEADADHAYEVAERLRQSVELAKIEVTSGTVLNVTTSIGVAELTADDRDIQDLLKRADEALYRAKGGGRNRVLRA